jgi:glycosyltransferase involved in cell wall biosynthesis
VNGVAEACRSGAVRVSAIIACYRDAPAIPVMYSRLKRVFVNLGIDGEIIFVNDGSTDDTASVIRRLREMDPCV